MSFAEISKIELTQLLKSENARFENSLNENLPFDHLKAIRQNIRLIEQEIISRAAR